MTVNVTALMAVREMLGWSHNAVEFTGGTLSDLLKELNTSDGKTLYELFTRENGNISSEYMVWLNCRPVKQDYSLEIPLQSGDRVIAMPAVRFARGG